MIQVAISPTALLDRGIRVETIEGLRLFKLTDELQTRLEYLLEGNETAALSLEEQGELEGLTELDRFFTYLNSRLLAST